MGTPTYGECPIRTQLAANLVSTPATGQPLPACLRRGVPERCRQAMPGRLPEGVGIFLG
ncbi:MAG: hypothetical protein MUC60_10245 [Oscillatoria sp. Prado101]|nr:hypothetical protein [Oscillatoria sp. Prado101]